MEQEEYPKLKHAFVDRELADQQKATMDDDHYKRLTSFLEVDHSFLTPWNWNSSGPDQVTASRSSMESKEESMKFQPGSFFSYEADRSSTYLYVRYS